MNHEDRKEVARQLAITAKYYGRQLDQDTLSLMLDDLMDLDYWEVMQSLIKYRRDPKNRVMPLPAQIRHAIQPEIEADAAAREIAARITAAIPKFGWNNGERARAYIGETGWRIVERQGGWSHLCQNHGVTIDPTAFQAQVRDLAKADLMYSTEKMHQAIGLAGNNVRQGELQSFGEIMGMLPAPGTEAASE